MTTSTNNTTSTTTQATTASIIGSTIGTLFGLTRDTIKLAIKLPVAGTAYVVGNADQVIDSAKDAMGIEGNLSATLRHVIDTDIVTLASDSHAKGKSDVIKAGTWANDLFVIDTKAVDVK